MNFKKRVNGSWTDTSHYIHNTSTDTITTLPVVLYPNDTTATVGLKGQAVQSSVPSPTSPVMPQGTGELETNLAIINGDSHTIKNYYYNDVRISDVLEIGTYTVSYVIEEKTGNASSSTIGFGSLYAYQKDFKSFTVANVPITITTTVTLESEGCLWARFLRSGSPTDFSYSVSHVRVEKGSHSYGYKIPISSANTTTPIYLGEVETTRKIKKLVLTGEETSWNEPAAGIHRLTLDGYMRENTNIPLCTHYIGAIPVSAAGDVGNLRIAFLISASGNNYMYIRDTEYTSITDFKSYLAAQYAAGTPVTVWYVLAEPTTGIVNEPLRKIGDYADEVSGISIPTIAGANTISVGTTLQPSEVTVNYKGWHPVADVHERENGQWN